MSRFKRYRRGQWGARPNAKPYVKWNVVNGKPMILGGEGHHSVTPVDPIPVTPDMDVDESARRIQNYHLDGKGWTDIFYHELIAYDGTRAEGRPWQFRSGSNPYLTICFVGNYQDLELSDAQKESFWEVIDEARFLGVGQHITWHAARDATACPGRKAIEWFKSGAPVPELPVESAVIEPAFPNLEPPVDTLSNPGYGRGVWQVTRTGGVYAWGGAPFYGSATGEDYFEGKRASRLVLPGRDIWGNLREKYRSEIIADKKYVIITSDNSRYAYPHHPA